MLFVCVFSLAPGNGAAQPTPILVVLLHHAPLSMAQTPFKREKLVWRRSDAAQRFFYYLNIRSIIDDQATPSRPLFSGTQLVEPNALGPVRPYA